MALRASLPITLTAEPSLSEPLCALQAQSRPRWCWAACVAMLLDALGTPKTQCAIAGAAVGHDCCGLGTESCLGAGGDENCDVTRDPVEIDAVLALHGITARRHDDVIGRETLEQELAHGRPVMVYLKGQRSSADHVMLVVGKPAGERFTVADPCLGEFTEATYEELRVGGRPWRHTWTDVGAQHG